MKIEIVKARRITKGKKRRSQASMRPWRPGRVRKEYPKGARKAGVTHGETPPLAFSVKFSLVKFLSRDLAFPT